MRVLFLCALLVSASAFSFGIYDIMIEAIQNNDLARLDDYASDAISSCRAQCEPWSPLHEAALRNNVGAAEILLRHGWNINERDGNGWTPLHISVQKDHFEVSNFLVSRGACGLIADARKNTVLEYVTRTNPRMVGVVLRSLLNKEPGEVD